MYLSLYGLLAIDLPLSISLKEGIDFAITEISNN